jgi:hypothetical protein
VGPTQTVRNGPLAVDIAATWEYVGGVMGDGTASAQTRAHAFIDLERRRPQVAGGLRTFRFWPSLIDHVFATNDPSGIVHAGVAGDEVFVRVEVRGATQNAVPISTNLREGAGLLRSRSTAGAEIVAVGYFGPTSDPEALAEADAVVQSATLDPPPP